jgi:ferredoxin
MAWQWILRQNDCTGCGICYDVCPHGAIAMPRDRAYPRDVPRACTGCMDCVEECPFDAIEVTPQGISSSS